MTDPEMIDLSDPAVEEPPELGAPSLAAAIEALLIIADEPMSAESLASTTGRSVSQVESTLQSLAEDYLRGGRGFELRQTSAGWRYYTSADAQVVVTVQGVAAAAAVFGQRVVVVVRCTADADVVVARRGCDKVEKRFGGILLVVCCIVVTERQCVTCAVEQTQYRIEVVR
mgnify:CR=1 FL=1